MLNEEQKDSMMNPLDVIRDSITEVIGDSGTERYSGYITEESNNIWRDEARVRIVEEMRRGDGAVKAVLNALKAPILATTWNVEGEDEEIVDFVKDNLFHLCRSWMEFLRESLTFLEFGYSVFELVFKVEKGRIVLCDLAPRIQHSIVKWRLTDKSLGVVQRIRTDEKLGPDGKTQLFDVEIPMVKLLVLTNEKEGDDLTGQSILRPAYKHYYYKNNLYSIQAIAAERHGVGVPVVKLPESYGLEQKEEAEEAASEYRSNEKSHVVLPPGFEMEILSPSGNPQGAAIDSAIQHHNKMILMSVLANFVGLGTDGTGSFALSKDQSSFFLKHVEDKAKYIAEQITEQVIKRLVYYNFGEDAECPKLTFSPLGDIDFAEMSATMKTLVDAGLLTADGKIQQFTRSVFKLPVLTDEEVEEMEMEESLANMEADMANDEFSFADTAETEVPEVPEDTSEEMPEEGMPEKPMKKGMKKPMK